MASEISSVAIIGCGNVGSACAASLLAQPSVRELILIDHSEDKALGEARDLQHSVPLGTPVKVIAGSYKEAAASQVAVITVGAPGKFTGSRLDMLKENVVLVRECIAKIMSEGFQGVLLLASNPVDVLTYIAQQESGLPVGQVIGTGTLIDSERLRAALAEHLKVDARSVHANVIGEHGDSSVPVWSSAQIGGIPLAIFPGANELAPRDELQRVVRQAGPEVAALKGNTCFAIAACVTRICQAILRDERSVLMVSTRIDGQYGLQDVSFSTPCIVGKNGIETVLELALNAPEQEALIESATILKEAFASL